MFAGTAGGPQAEAGLAPSRVRASPHRPGRRAAPGGLVAGSQVVGRGDEIVSTRNDRRLITTTGVWVRNGDRWHVDARHHDTAPRL